jgi:hypothetical protein
VERPGSRRTLAVLVLSVALAACAGAPSSGILPPGTEPLPTAVATPGASPAATASEPTDPAAPPTDEPLTPVPTAAAPTSRPTDAPRPTVTPRPVKAHWDTLGFVAPFAVREVDAARLSGDRVLFLAHVEDGEGTSTPYASLWSPSTGKVREVRPLNTFRKEYVLLSLRDGRAMVVGGTNDRYQSYSSTWIFSAAGGGRWTKTGLLHQARSAPCAAVLRDGRVLVAGGYYHVKPDWGSVGAPITLAAARPTDPASGGPALDDVAPPYAGAAMATAELFDPKSGIWSKTGSMRWARAVCQAVTLRDGRVLVFGSGSPESGVSLPEAAFNTAELYDPATGRWSSAGRLPAGNEFGSGGSLVATSNGGAVLIGVGWWWKHQGEMTRSFRFWAGSSTWRQIGRTWEITYNPADGKPITITRGVRNLAGAAVAALPDGRVLVAGGGSVPIRRSDSEGWYDTVPVRDVLAYVPKTNRWQDLPRMRHERQSAAVVTLSDGSVIVAGGVGPDWKWLRSFARFTPAR